MRHQAEGHLDGAGGRDEVAGHGLGGAHREFAQPRPEHLVQRGRFRLVVEHRAGAVGVHVVDLARGETARGQGGLHRGDRSGARGVAPGERVGVHRRAVAEHLAENRRAALPCVRKRLEDEERRAFAENEAVAAPIEGPRLRRGSPSGIARALMSRNSIIGTGAICESAAPHTIRSASPRWIVSNAIPIASLPEAHAV